MSIQSSINSMLGTLSGGVRAAVFAKRIGERNNQMNDAADTKSAEGSSIQKRAANRAAQSVADEIDAKKTQKRNFMDYLGKQPTSLGGTVEDLPITLQKQIASQYNKNQRKSLMGRMHKEANRG